MLNQRDLDVLSILLKSEEPMTSTDITNEMKGLTQSTVLVVLRSMVSQKYVEVAGVTHSGKVLSRTYVATEEGRKAVLEHFVEYYRSFTNIVSSSEICAAILKTGGVNKKDIEELRACLEKF